MNVALDIFVLRLDLVERKRVFLRVRKTVTVDLKRPVLLIKCVSPKMVQHLVTLTWVMGSLRSLQKTRGVHKGKKLHRPGRFSYY